MDSDGSSRPRALSHKEYLDTLQRPSAAEARRISEIQTQKEQEIAAKYHTAEERDAASLIQRAYRGHRERRQLEGLNLDPSSRWAEIIREWKYRSAIAPHLNSAIPARERSPSDLAKLNWRRAGQIAEHASAGISTPSLRSSGSLASKWSRHKDEPDSMLLDLRYFLEMVDQKHRYGANLQVYHEVWQNTGTTQNFFYWLDHGDGRHEDLSMCSREKLEKERIRYLSKEERQNYLVEIDSEGKLRWAKNGNVITTSVEDYQDSMHGIVPKGSTEPAFNDEDVKRQLSADAGFSSKLATVSGMFRDAVKEHEDEANFRAGDDSSSTSSSSSSSNSDQHPGRQIKATDHPLGTSASHLDTKAETQKNTKKKKKKIHVSPATILNSLLRASVRPGTWIYVSDTLGRLYVGIKSSGAFQHASFLSGARISSAGIIGIKGGQLTYLSPLSGHYRPTTKSFRAFIESLKAQGCDMKHVKVSKSYAILLGMEFYGKGKKDLRKVFKPEKEARREEKVKKREERDLLALPVESVSATNRVERHWEEDHEKRKLARLMDDLHVKREGSEEGR